MKHLIKLSAFLLFIVNNVACHPYKTSPGITYRNYSEDYLHNIEVNWNGYRLRGGKTNMNPGDSSGENFLLRKKSDLFGPVHIEWENAQKKKIVKDFLFTKEQMPNFSYERNGHVSFYLTQDDLIMFAKPEGVLSVSEEKKILKEVGQISRDLDSICFPTSAYGNPPKGDPRPPISSGDCKRLLPIYQPANMPKILKARKLYEEQEKQRLKNIEEYKKSKAKEYEITKDKR